MTSRSKAALVISGGGAKGAFAVGVIKHLYSEFRKSGWFSIVGGSSVGALISPFATLMGGPEDIGNEALSIMLDTFTSTTKDDVLEKRHFLQRIRRSNYIHETDSLEELLTDLLKPEWFGWLQSEEAPHCYVVYTNFRTGEKTVTSPKDPNIDRKDFIRAMRASASIPIYMEGTSVNGEVCYDGGLRDPLPTEEAIRQGAEVMVPVLLTLPRMKNEDGDFNSLRKVLFRAVGILLDECKFNDIQLAELICSANVLKEKLMDEFQDEEEILSRIEKIFEEEEFQKLYGGRKKLSRIIHGLQPDNELSEDILAIEPEQMKKWVKKGEKKAKEIVTESPFL